MFDTHTRIGNQGSLGLFPMKLEKMPNIALANPMVLQFRKFHPAALSDTPGTDPFLQVLYKSPILGKIT